MQSRISDIFRPLASPSCPTKTFESPVEVKQLKESCSGPSYPDLAVLSEKDYSKPNTKQAILTGEWSNVHTFEFPQRTFGKIKRRSPFKVLEQHKWLRYSQSTDALYCAPCFLFGSKYSKHTSFSSSPVTDWKNLQNVIARHLKDGSEHHGCVIQADNFVSVFKGEQHPIEQQLNTQSKITIEKNRIVLKAIIDTIILCGHQNIAIRGHTEEDSNFIAILEYRAKTDPILAVHLKNGDPRVRYLSPQIQNEQIDLVACQIREDLVLKCNSTPCFSLIADEATDSSTKEQIAICVRFIDALQEGKLEVREDLVGFTKAERTTGEALAQNFITSLQNFGIDITKMKGQGYDGASNMRGVHRGVQARIQALLPGAQYVHCHAHCLNLAIVHASTEQLVRNMMSTVQEINFAFSYSAKRMDQFQESLNSTPHVMKQREKLRTLCDTRWSARADALYTFLNCFDVVVDALDNLKDLGDNKASSHLNNILRFDFIIALVTAEHVLQSTVALSKFLQKKSVDLVEALDEAKVVKEILRGERGDDDVWTELYEKAVAVGQKHDVEARIPRLAGRQQQRINVPADTPKDYYKRALYLPFVDHLLSEIQDRLVAPEGRFLAQFLIPSKLHSLTVDLQHQLLHHYEAELRDHQGAVNELQRWKTKWGQLDRKPETIRETLEEMNPGLYPNIHAMLAILLTLPVTTATAERSFSMMRRVKTYMRSKMGQERFSSLCLIHGHKDFKVNVDEVIAKFAGQKSRRLTFLFQK